MAIDNKIKNLNKQLYPTGRVWRINPNSIKEKFVNGLLASEIRAYNDGVSILDSTIPDNPNFTVDDASAWEKRLGLPDGTGVALEDRIKAIVVQLNWPGTNPAKGAADYIEDVLQAAGYNVCVHENLFTSAGTSWTSYSAPSSNSWQAVTYGNGLFVAVSNTGIGNRVMTSTDGINWTARVSADDNSWQAVTYGNGLFVAVASSGASNRIMTSPDGISWTLRTPPFVGQWDAVTYGNGLFVAVSFVPTTLSNGIMTSPDGINWTGQTTPSIKHLAGITYGNGLFVAVGTIGAIVTSPDGITWTDRVSPSTNQWTSIAYGNGLFVAVAATLTNRVMTSTDGINWTARVSADESNVWLSVSYGNNIFVAVSISGTGDRIMTSQDGITWTRQNSPADSNWTSICFGNNIFVAVASNGFPNNTMASVGGGYFYKTFADFAGIGLVRHKPTLLHGQQRHGSLSSGGVIIANSVDPSVDDSFNLGDYSDTIFIGGCPPGTFINIPKAQETAFRQFILKIKPVNITVLLLVHFV